MPKNIFLVLFLIILSFIIFLFEGCDLHPDYGPFSDFYILGKIQNWEYEKTTIKAGFISPRSGIFHEYAKDSVFEDGIFHIIFKKDPVDSLMMLIDTSAGGQCQSSFYISHPYGYAPLHLFLYNQKNEFVGIVYKTNIHDTASAGVFELQYAYFNRQVNISGSRTCLSIQGDTILAEYDIVSKVMWNIISTQYLDYTPGMIHTKTTANELPEAKWFCYYWGTDMLKKKDFLTKHKILLNE